MSHLPVALYIQYDKPHPDKQEALCLAYADRMGLKVAALCRDLAAGIAMIRSGGIRGVITACDPDAEFRDGVDVAGGRLFVAREHTQPRPRRDVSALIGRMLGIGLSPRDMARVLEISTVEVRAAMLRHQRPPRRSVGGAGY